MKRCLIIRALLLMVTLAPEIAHTAPAVVWTGPGQMACRGQCSLEWALSLLSPEHRDSVKAAMEESPLGYSIPIRDGAVFSMMSYFSKEAQADMRTTVAVLDADEPAVGWHLDGWSFVQISGCQNWAVLMDVPAISGVLNESPESNRSGVGSIGPVTYFNFPQMAGILLESDPRLPIVLGESEVVTPVRPLNPNTPVVEPEEETPIPIVLPATSEQPKPPTVVPLPLPIYLLLISFLPFFIMMRQSTRKTGVELR